MRDRPHRNWFRNQLTFFGLSFRRGQRGWAAGGRGGWGPGWPRRGAGSPRTPQLSDGDASSSIEDDFTAQSVLDDWGIHDDPRDLPVMLLPDSLAWLIERGKWQDVLLLTRWRRHLWLRDGDKGWARSIVPSHRQQWPPQESPTWGLMGKHLGDPEAPVFEPPDLDAQHLRLLSNRVRKWAPRLTHDSEEVCDTVATLDEWASQLASAAGDDLHSSCIGNTWRHAISR